MYAYLSDALAAEKRGQGMGILTASVTLALVIGVPFGLKTTELFHSWQAPFRILAYACFGVLVCSMIFLKRLETLKKQRASFFAPFLNASQNSQIRATLFLIVFLTLAQFSITPNLTLFFRNICHVSPSQLIWIFALAGITSSVSAPITGKLSDRHGSLPVLRILLVLSLIVAGGFLFVLESQIFSVIALGSLCVAFLVTSTSRVVPLMSYLTTLGDPKDRGSLLLVQNTTQQISSGVAGTLAGLLMSLGTTESTGYRLVFSFSLLSLFISQWMVRKLRSQNS